MRPLHNDLHRYDDQPSIVRGCKQYVDTTSLVGVPYKRGGRTTEGLDCFGLIYLAFLQVGVKLIDPIDDRDGVGRSMEFTHVRAMEEMGCSHFR